MTNKRIFLFFGLVLFILLGRLLDHPANFAPVSAVAIFATVYLSKRWGYTAALVGMLLSDVFIGFYDIRLMVAVYGSFALIGFMAKIVTTRSGWSEIIGASILASLIFFFITNAAVWWLTPAYSKDVAGLIQAYIMGLPFFRNTLLGDLFFTSILFGLARVYQRIYNRQLDIISTIIYNIKV